MVSTKRVLLYRLGSLGDTVVALPALHLVARAFPDAERRLLTNFPIHAKAPPAAAILENTGLVHGYFRYAVGVRSPLKLLALWWQIRRWQPDVLVYLGPPRGIASARRDAQFFGLCGVTRQIGIPLTEDMQLNRLLPDAALGYDSVEPEASRLARNVAELGDAYLHEPQSWDLCLSVAEHDKAAELLAPIGERPLIAVSIGTKVQANDWGVDNWRQLLSSLAELYPGYALALTGAQSDLTASERVAKGWCRHPEAGPALNFCGKLTPRQSAAVFARARIYLGHDSGPMHLAAAVQTPCVAVFSARGKPRTWFPYGSQHRVLYHKVDCWGCGLDKCTVQKKKCILSISVAEVMTEVRAILG
jgi:heptosyltransferase III